PKEQRQRSTPGVSSATYSPHPGSESAFLYARFRPEFRTAFDAWIATDPLGNTSAPSTPFAMADYTVAEARQSDELERQADAFSERARQANQRGDNYVLMTIVFASVLVLLGIGSKM